MDSRLHAFCRSRYLGKRVPERANQGKAIPPTPSDYASSSAISPSGGEQIEFDYDPNQPRLVRYMVWYRHIAPFRSAPRCYSRPSVGTAQRWLELNSGTMPSTGVPLGYDLKQ